MDTPTSIEAQLASGGTGNNLHLDHPWPPQPTPCPSPLRNTLLVASLEVGIQFGWAIQLSLLTPYVELLNISHSCSPFIWLCGPLSAVILQPLIGYYSDHSTSRFGRRRPFIVAGVGLVVFAEFLIGYAVDFGYSSNTSNPNSHAAPNFGYFLVGFIILDAGNSMLQVACRALLGDMAAEDHARAHIGNAAFSFFMAVGNILGYAVGTYVHSLYRVFPFSRTVTCDVDCANLKSCIIISIALLIALTSLVLSFVDDEKTYLPSMELEVKRARPPFLGALKSFTRPMWFLLLVTCLNWSALFPFLLFDTDWMGKEVYGGVEGQPRYDRGVRVGALGLMLNSVVMGVTSLAIEPLGRWVGGAKRLWGIANLWLAICMAMAVLVTKMAWHERHQVAVGGVVEVSMPFGVVKACALAVFSLLGIPFAITCSTPFALASIFSVSSGAGQGFSLGILNLAIVIPQILVSSTSGPWDGLFGGGNLPSFVVGAVVATASAILSFTLLPGPNELKISMQEVIL